MTRTLKIALLAGVAFATALIAIPKGSAAQVSQQHIEGKVFGFDFSPGTPSKISVTLATLDAKHTRLTIDFCDPKTGQPVDSQSADKMFDLAKTAWISGKEVTAVYTAVGSLHCALHMQAYDLP
jgi:hypothetical protein